MKNLTSLLSVALLSGAITLGAYKLFIEKEASQPQIVEKKFTPVLPTYTPTSYTKDNLVI